MTVTQEQAHSAVAYALGRIVPDADIDAIDDEADMRDALELDSLDFLSFVELVSNRTGRRIDEDDYPELRTVSSCIAFLSGTGEPNRRR